VRLSGDEWGGIWVLIRCLARIPVIRGNFRVFGMTDCKGKHPVTAKVDAETRESLDRDADRLSDFRADRVRDALSVYLQLRRAEFQCPHCEKAIQIQP
jgi:hypothetical protein